MNEKKSVPKLHHYVPQFLLKLFAAPGGEQIHVFDKSSDRQFCPTIRNVGAENHFYDLKLPHGDFSAESTLSELETEAAGKIRKLLLAQNLNVLSAEDRVVVALFVSIQMVRVPHVVDIMHELTETIRGKWGEMDGMPSKGESREKARAAMVQNLSDAVTFIPEFLNKDWVLLKPSDGSVFFISDNPVVMHNSVKNLWRGSLGLSVKGIEVYFPLSPDTTLAFFCKSLSDGCRVAKAQYEAVKASGLIMPENISTGIVTISNILRAVDTGAFIQRSKDVTDFMNGLQVWHAVRFLFSNSSNFELAKEAIRHDSQLKSGPKLSGG